MWYAHDAVGQHVNAVGRWQAEMAHGMASVGDGYGSAIARYLAEWLSSQTAAS